MIFHVLTIFPEFFRGPFEHGVVARAAKSGKLQIRIHDLRDWSFDFHKSVDDRPFGGGEGMLMKPEPVFLAAESILPQRKLGERSSKQRVLLTSAQGPLFDQRAARRLSEFEEVLLICGRYEGVDERVAQFLADEEVSIGEYVLSGGELAAAVVIDAVSRLLPGVLGNEDSSRQESFSTGEGDLLDHPHYTRPADFRGMRAPEVLLGGNHEAIRRWRQQAALEKTRRVRPERLKESKEEEDE